MGQDCICILLFISKCMLHGIFYIVFHKVRTEIHVNATDFKNAHFESVFAFVRAFLAYIFNYKAWELMALEYLKLFSWDSFDIITPEIGICSLGDLPFGWEYKRKGEEAWLLTGSALGFLQCPSPLVFSTSLCLSLLSGEERRKGKECLYGAPLTALLAAAVVLSVHALALRKWAKERVSLLVVQGSVIIVGKAGWLALEGLVLIVFRKPSMSTSQLFFWDFSLVLSTVDGSHFLN